MFEIGPSLREARTRRGLSAEDVQKAIRIRDRYLHALEEERWELLPGDAYVKGFLRTYAEFLGLNGTLYVDEYTSRYAHRDEHSLVPEAMAPVETARIGLLRPLLAIVAIVAAVAAVAAWQLHGSPSSPPTSAGSSDVADTQTTASTPATTHHASKPKTHTTTAAAAPTRAVLVASRGRVWLEVRAGGATGSVLYEGVLAQGETLPVTLSPRVWVWIGAPWNLDVKIGGKLASGMPSQPAKILIGGSGLSPAA